MSESEEVRIAIEEKFHGLGDKLRVQRERRLWLEVDGSMFRPVLDFLTGELRFTILCTITGLDEGPSLGYLYHLARESGALLSLKTMGAKGEAIRTVTDAFPGASVYERELVDLLGAVVEGLPEGLRYPLPDDWPAGQFPLRKDFVQSVLDYGVPPGAMPSEAADAASAPDAADVAAPVAPSAVDIAAAAPTAAADTPTEDAHE